MKKSNIECSWSLKTIFSFLMLMYFTSCNTTYIRAFIRRDANVKDYLYFPERIIHKSDNVYEFKKETNPLVEDKLEKLLNVDDFQTFINKTKTQSFMVIKDNNIIFEAYGSGYNKDSIVTSFSVAKSFDSAMIGKLIEQGKIKSEYQPITDFIPELVERDKRFCSIRICDLLGMCSGISYDEKFKDDDTKTYYDPDLRSLVIYKTEIGSEPGKEFLYNNYNPLFLGIIIERVAGMSVSSYLEKNIWQPMGGENDGSWSLDSNKDAFEKMESGINGRTMDFARFGCLYRDLGIINGKRVISEEWIRKSTSNIHEGENEFYTDSFGKKISSAKNGGYYGYFWYGLKRKDFDRDDFFAAGNKGQIIYVSPKTNLVIVRFGEKYGIDFWKWISVFYDFASEC